MGESPWLQRGPGVHGERKACSMIATHCEALASAFLGRPTIPATLPDSSSPRLASPPRTCHHYLTTAIAYGSRATLLFLLAAVHQEFVASLWCALCIEERGVGGAESALCGFGWDWFLRGWGGLFLVGAANCSRSLSLVPPSWRSRRCWIVTCCSGK